MSLGLLVGSFGDFVREQYVSPVAAGPIDESDLPDTLFHIREICAHHLIPLALLARADGNSDAMEQKAIFDYCAMLLQKSDVMMSVTERAAFKDYISAFRPSLMQLDLALKKIEREPKERIATLFGAAINVVEADGERDPNELRFLAKLSDDLAKIERD